MNVEVKAAIEVITTDLSSLLGVDIEFRHIGSSALGIKGKKDIDLEVLVSPKDFTTASKKMISKYGQPKKKVDNNWYKFETMVKDWDVDLFLSTPHHPITIRNKLFFDHLKNNPNAREEYLHIKEASEKVSREAYSKAKNQFLNITIKRLNS